MSFTLGVFSDPGVGSLAVSRRAHSPLLESVPTDGVGTLRVNGGGEPHRGAMECPSKESLAEASPGHCVW